MLIRYLLFLFVFSPINAVPLGTDTYLEVEYRYALDPSYKVNFMEIERVLKETIASDKLKIPLLLNRKYRLVKERPAFFYDTYYDYEGVLEEANSSLRVRYRYYNSLFSSFLEPKRCEIQLKNNYKIVNKFFIEVKETRFEFRKDSSPFREKLKLPKNPCKSEYLEHILKSGKIQWQETNFSFKLKQDLKNFSLRKVVIVRQLRTIRSRYHLEIENPWGQMPNPHQIFFITVDKILDKLGNHLFTEVEIERDRSVLVNLTKPFRINHPLRELANKNIEFSLMYLNSDFLNLHLSLYPLFMDSVRPFQTKLKRSKSRLDPS
jgi:hypothetical protein